MRQYLNSHGFVTFLAYLPFLLVCAVIFAFSSMQNPPIPAFMRFEDGDKVLHFIAFMGLGGSGALATSVSRQGIGWAAFLQAWLLCALYGFLDELHQSFVPERVPSYTDWLADIFGAAVGISCFFLLVIAAKRTLVAKQ